MNLPRAVSVLACSVVLLSAAPSANSNRTIVFMSDFGLLDDSVALCKGVMLTIAPEARLVDLTHQVEPFSIFDGARFLAGAAPHFPADTVFVGVVDPGVGSTRKPIVARTKRGQLYVLPDNGLITLIEKQEGLEGVRELKNPEWHLARKESSTFHGRDLFSPAAAHLARGEAWTAAGPELKTWVRLDIALPRVDAMGAHGLLVAKDGPYGNLISNLSGDAIASLGYQVGDNVTLRVGTKSLTLPFMKTFSDVPVGKNLLYIDSRGHLGLAKNQGSFLAENPVTFPVALEIPAKPAR